MDLLKSKGTNCYAELCLVEVATLHGMIKIATPGLRLVPLFSSPPPASESYNALQRILQHKDHKGLFIQNNSCSAPQHWGSHWRYLGGLTVPGRLPGYRARP